MTEIDLDLLRQELHDSLDRLSEAAWDAALDRGGAFTAACRLDDARTEYMQLKVLAAFYGVAAPSAS